MPMNPDALDPTARTGGTGLPGTGSSSGKKGKRRDWEQMQPASPSLSSLKETKSGKQNHLFSTFLPSLCPLGNLPPPSAGWHSTTLHTHPLTPSCPHRVPEQHPQRLHRATDRDTDRHTHIHTSPWSRRRETEPSGGLLGREATAPWHGAVRAAPEQQPRFLTGAPHSGAARGEAQRGRATRAFPPPPPSPASSSPHRRHQPHTAPSPAQDGAWEM